MRRSRTSLWILAGAAAPILYAATVALGGVLTPGYSHIAGPVSALIMAGAPAAVVLIPLFALYNALLASFALPLRDAFRERGVRLSLLVPVFLAVTALAGVAMLVYPMDPIGREATEAGRLHVFFAAIAALGTMIAVLFTATALVRHPDWRVLALHSFATLAALAVAGTTAGILAADLSPWMGLAERVVIGAFLQWLLVLAIALLRTGRPATSA